MSRRLTFATILALCLSLLGCTPPVPSAVPPVETKEALITLRVAQRGGSPLSSQLLDELISAWQQTQAGYRLEKVPFESGPAGLEAMHKAMQEGKLDLVPVHFADMERLYPSLLPLDPFLRRGFDPAPMGALLEQHRYNGELFELPYAVRPALLFANTEMLTAAGVTVGSEGWTWEEFREAVRRLTRGAGEEKVWGLETQYPQYLARAYVEERTGGPVWHAGPEAIGEVLHFFRTLVFTDEALAKDGPQDWEKGVRITRHILRALLSGEAAITLEPYADIGIAPPRDITWDVLPVPSFAGRKPVLPVFPYTLAIPRNSQRPDDAWAFLRFIAGPEGAVTLARLGTLPVYRSEAVAEAWSSRMPGLPPGAATVWDTDWTRMDYPWGYEADMLRAFHRAVNTTLSGAATVEQAVERYWQDRAAIGKRYNR